MGGWTVSDDAGHSYIVHDGFTLGPDETVTLHTGSGTDTDDRPLLGVAAAGVEQRRRHGHGAGRHRDRLNGATLH